MTKRPKHAARKMRITELTVRRAKPQARAFLTWDTKAPNLALRTQPSDFKSWCVIYSRNNRVRWLTLGNAASIPLEQARTMAAETMLAVARGGDPAAERKAERGAGTFAEMHSRYLEGFAKKHNKSWRQADALVRRFAIPKWGKLQASAVTRADVKQMVASIEAPVLANQTLAAISALFSWAIREEIVTTANPARLVERHPTRGRERILNESEVPLFWQAFGDLDPVRGAALKMIWLCGQRPGEIAHMRREHIVDGWWQMPGEPVPGIWPGTKNGASHRVWIPKAAQALLANGGSGFVFAGPRGGPITRLDDDMRTICAKLGVERATPHDLRRSHGSTITALGFGRDAMNRIQNHKEGGIADVYDRHRYASETKQIMETVASRITALAEGRGEKKIVYPHFRAN